MIGYSKKIEKIIRESAFDEKKKKRGLKFSPGLALTGVQTTGPRVLQPFQEKLTNNTHSKFWGANRVHYGKCGSGVCADTEKSTIFQNCRNIYSRLATEGLNLQKIPCDLQWVSKTYKQI